MNITPELLTSLNLSNAEAAVYLATLELGQGSILDIARKSGVKRSSIYNFIEELKTRGLLIETKKKKRAVFSAAPPRSLVEIEQTRLKDLHRLLPELEAIENQSRTKPRVTFYEGLDGIKQVYADSLRTPGQIIRGYSDFEAGLKVVGDAYYTEHYVLERKKKNIFYHAIARDNQASHDWAKWDNQGLRETRFMPGEGVTTEMNIYGDHIALISFRAKIPFAVLIEDKDLAHSMRLVWQQLWDRLG
jgi:HTH-type transcriptional regulator, sugar sensing transcriptional regulator